MTKTSGLVQIKAYKILCVDALLTIGTAIVLLRGGRLSVCIIPWAVRYRSTLAALLKIAKKIKKFEAS
jgi:hypothetical protein